MLRSKLRASAKQVGSALLFGPSCSSANSLLQTSHLIVSTAAIMELNACKIISQLAPLCWWCSQCMQRTIECRCKIYTAVQERASSEGLHGIRAPAACLMCDTIGESAMGSSTANSPSLKPRIMNSPCSAAFT